MSPNRPLAFVEPEPPEGHRDVAGLALHTDHGEALLGAGEQSRAAAAERVEDQAAGRDDLTNGSDKEAGRTGLRREKT